MLEIIDLITYYDIAKLSKEQLISMAVDLKLSDVEKRMSSSEIASNIYKKILTFKAKKETELERNFIEKYEDVFFSGRGAISWFLDTSEVKNLKKFVEKLKNEDDRKPFEKKEIDVETELQQIDPLLMGAFEFSDGHYLMRYVTKTGYVFQPGLTENKKSLRLELANVFIFPNKNLIEVRSSRNVSVKISRVISNYILENIDENVSFEKIDFNNDLALDTEEGPVEFFSRKLDGTIVENVDIPKNIYQDMSSELLDSINKIFVSIDARISVSNSDNIDDVNGEIDNAKSDILENFPDVPFFALILSGLEKVDLGSESELRDTPLYKSLSDHLKTKTSYIQFIPNIDGTKSEKFTIRIGLSTNSVVFPINTTEDVIMKVRDAILTDQ